jgi:hypothetical protein
VLGKFPGLAMLIERLREVVGMADEKYGVMKSAVAAPIAMGHDIDATDLAEPRAPGKNPEAVLPAGPAFETRFA